MSARQRARTSGRTNAYEAITARIIAALERGTVPWRRPWSLPGSGGHRNAVTERSYRGINPLLLGLAALERDFDDPRWLTFWQALARGGHVRRGERGTQIVLWRWVERERGEGGELAERFPLLRLFTVFNAAQCDGLDLPPLEPGKPFRPLQRSEAIAAEYEGGPPVLHDAPRAYYAPAKDEVHLPPPAAFGDPGGYYATLFHELSHSTGHASRLNRPGFEREVAPFGSERCSREELVAEFGAAFLNDAAGVDPSGTECRSDGRIDARLLPDERSGKRAVVVRVAHVPPVHRRGEALQRLRGDRADGRTLEIGHSKGRHQPVRRDV